MPPALLKRLWPLRLSLIRCKRLCRVEPFKGIWRDRAVSQTMSSAESGQRVPPTLLSIK